MSYREYDKPIPVTIMTLDGPAKGMAMGVKEEPITDSNKSCFSFLVELEDGSGALVSQKDIFTIDGRYFGGL